MSYRLLVLLSKLALPFFDLKTDHGRTSQKSQKKGLQFDHTYPQFLSLNRLSELFFPCSPKPKLLNEEREANGFMALARTISMQVIDIRMIWIQKCPSVPDQWEFVACTDPWLKVRQRVVMSKLTGSWKSFHLLSSWIDRCPYS